MKKFFTWSRATIAALLLASLGIVAVHATQGGTNSTQAALFDLFCDQCGLASNTNLRNLIASTVTLQDTQTITGAKTFTSQITTTGGITGGSITGTNAPYVLAQSGVPFIYLSSGSVSAGGAITGITALNTTYANAFCWFPANALATTISAGWYFCQFSGTTTGTACLNTYTSGPPTIPGSCTAVTDGKGAFNSDTSEHGGPSITIPAGAIGANGSITAWIDGGGNNTANSKGFLTYFNGTGGTNLVALINIASTLNEVAVTTTRNRGTASAQQTAAVSAANGGFGSNSSARIYSAVNTGNSNTYDISLKKVTATDNVILEGFTLEVRYGQ